jgi:hypothetical protein
MEVPLQLFRLSPLSACNWNGLIYNEYHFIIKINSGVDFFHTNSIFTNRQHAAATPTV